MVQLLRFGVVTLVVILWSNQVISEVVNPAVAGLVLQIDQLGEEQFRR